MEASGFLPGGALKGASGSRPDGTAMTAREATDADAVTLGRLRNRAEFLRLRGGPSWASPSLVLQARANKCDDADLARFGFTATKRLGGAVRRNRARRRLKEAVRQVAPLHARPCFDYVVIARQGSLTRAFPDILKELKTALRRVHDSNTRSRTRR